MIRLLIVDDDYLITTALKTILEAEGDLSVCGIGKDGNDAVRLYKQLQPDLLLMDIRMEHLDGLNAAEQILQSYPDARILLLTTFSDDEYIIKALHLGARGYILKQDYTGISPAIRAVLERTNCIWRRDHDTDSKAALSHRKLSITKRINLPAVNFLSLSLWQMDAATEKLPKHCILAKAPYEITSAAF